MAILKYLKPKKSEILDLFFIILSLTSLFSISWLNWSDSNLSPFLIFLVFFLFISFLLGSRLILMKFIGYENAYEIDLKQNYFDRYWLNTYDKLSFYSDTKHSFIGNVSNLISKEGEKAKFKGIPMPAMAFVIYIFTLGVFIYPALWNFRIRKIEHRFIGTHQKFEYGLNYMYNQDISEYRFSKALMGGFLYYALIVILLGVIFSGTFYRWFVFITLWIGIVSIIPIFGSEGYDLWRKNNLVWVGCVTVLIMCLLSVLIFDSSFYILLFTLGISVFLLVFFLWRKLIR